jgi:hypothetical protein
MSPGDKNLRVVFNGTSTNFDVKPNPSTSVLTILPEDARVAYTGDLLVPVSTSGATTVELSALVNDISAEIGGDSWPGDIRNATVSFVNRATNTVIGTVPVNLISPSDKRKGKAVFSWTGATEGAYTIGIVVGGYHIRNASADNTVVQLYRQVGDLVTGGGTISPVLSSGKFSSDPDKKINFGFLARFNQSAVIINSDVIAVFRKTYAGMLRTFQIEGTDIRGLNVNVDDPNAMTSSFRCTGTLTDITDPLAPVYLIGDLDINVAYTDRGLPGTVDGVSFEVWSGGTLYYSSNWIADVSKELNLIAGNILIQSNYNVEADMVTGIDGLIDSGPNVRITAYPNPSSGVVNFKFKVDVSSKVTLDILSSTGALVSRVYEGYADSMLLKTITWDSRLPQGIYWYKLSTQLGIKYGKIVITKTF